MASSRWRMKAIGLVLVMVAAAGCGPRYAVAPEPMLQTATVRELVARLAERTKSIQSVKALVTVQVEGQPAVTAGLSIARPSEGEPPSLRLKGFDPFGRTLFDLIAVGDRVRLTIPGEGRILESSPGKPMDPAWPVQADELRLLATSLIGPFVVPGEVPVIERAGALYLIHLIRVTDGEGRLSKRLWVERAQLRLEREEFFREEAEADRIEFYDYRRRSGIEWPDRAVLSRPSSDAGRGGRLELWFREVHLNAVIPSEEFILP